MNTIILKYTKEEAIKISLMKEKGNKHCTLAKKVTIPAKNISNRMPCKVPNTIIVCIWNFNLRSIMPVYHNIKCHEWQDLHEADLKLESTNYISTVIKTQNNMTLSINTDQQVHHQITELLLKGIL